MFYLPAKFHCLPLVLEIMGNMHIAIICFPGFDNLNFKINLIFLIKPFSYPIGTERKLNVQKTFRRRPASHLSVLFTFNLRPVSTGYMTK